jgi:methylmalonyl-CoA mutase cobalamin-binding subunit
MNQALETLEPVLAGSYREPAARVVLGTVQQDVHDIGKNLVGIMLKGSGFEVYDVGTNLPSEKFIETAREHKARLICMSSLLTTSMPAMKACIEAIKSSDIRDSVKTMVGCDVVVAQTGGANRLRLNEFGLEDRAVEFTGKLAQLAREAAPQNCCIEGILARTGHFTAPAGDVTEEELYEIYEEQVSVLVEEGVDYFRITESDPQVLGI